MFTHVISIISIDKDEIQLKICSMYNDYIQMMD